MIEKYPRKEIVMHLVDLIPVDRSPAAPESPLLSTCAGILRRVVLVAFVLALRCLPAAGAPSRERILFNAGWRFQLEDASQAAAGEDRVLGGWMWHAVPDGTTVRSALAAPPATEDGAWQSASAGQDVFDRKPGLAWFHVVLPSLEAASRAVHFVSVDDNATVLLNRQVLASHEGWDEPFDVALDQNWHSGGENVLLVLVENVSGPGGMGEVRILNQAKAETAPQAQADFDDQNWETVNLPHYAHLEPYNVSKHWQGICWYRKTFVPDATMRGRSVALEFEGAMQLAQVWVNGELRCTHAGGYLPFTVDLSADCAAGRPVHLAVRLDNRNHNEFVPGKPLADMDFCYFSGLYRDVVLNVADPVHITDSVAEQIAAGGGIFVTYPAVTRDAATVQVQTHVRNDGKSSIRVQIACALLDGNGREVVHGSSEVKAIAGAGADAFTQRMEVTKPLLWHPEHPHLYTLRVRVMDGGRVVDEQSLRIGIRRIAVDPEKGFLINGEPLLLNGTNRHQQYPWVGNAISDNCAYRDMRKLKEAGFNYVRLCHYPQSPAVMQACDELGLLAIVCVPGWQYFRRDKTFVDSIAQAEQDMVRWHRNHPSAALWEVSLNESGMPGGVLLAMNKLVHAEYPGDQILTCGATAGDGPAERAYEIPYSGWDQASFSRPAVVPGRMALHREYGDFEFGGNNSTSRAARGDGVDALLLMAWNYQWECNKNLTYPWTIGQSSWVGIDYNRGYYPKPCTCSVLDAVRLPKFLYYFFQSQRDPALVRSDIGSGPMVYIANLWSERSPHKVVVYSNCEEVELFVNGQSIAKRKPDNGPDTDYGKVPAAADPLYWQDTGGKLPPVEHPGNRNVATFDGGNCRHLAHPPFTFPSVAFTPGELKAVGIIGGKPAATMVRKTSGAAARLALVVDLAGRDLSADGADAVFVHAEVLDADGTLIWDAQPMVHFSVSGNATLIGGPELEAEAGVASVLVRAGLAPGIITVTATSEGLPTATTTVEARPSSISDATGRR